MQAQPPVLAAVSSGPELAQVSMPHWTQRWCHQQRRTPCLRPERTAGCPLALDQQPEPDMHFERLLLHLPLQQAAWSLLLRCSAQAQTCAQLVKRCQHAEAVASYAARGTLCWRLGLMQPRSSAQTQPHDEVHPGTQHNCHNQVHRQYAVVLKPPSCRQNTAHCALTSSSFRLMTQPERHSLLHQACARVCLKPQADACCGQCCGQTAFWTCAWADAKLACPADELHCHEPLRCLRQKLCPWHRGLCLLDDAAGFLMLSQNSEPRCRG